jgi:hypothetical protein
LDYNLDRVLSKENAMEPLILVAVGFIFLIIGLIFGFGLSSMLRRNAKTPTNSEPVATPPPPAVPSRFTPKESVELLSVWHNERTHKLLALLEGKPLSPTQIDSEQRNRLAQILSGLHQMIGDDPALEEEKAAAKSEMEEEQEIVEEMVKEDLSDALPDPQEMEGELPKEGLDAAGAPKKVYFADTLPQPVSFREALGSNPFKINVPSSPKPTSAPKSIIEQIDEILQDKIAGTPLEEKEIKLEESPEGMAIKIGSLMFEGIDAVPDPTIRALIKESAREWNEKVSRKRGS